MRTTAALADVEKGVVLQRLRTGFAASTSAAPSIVVLNDFVIQPRRSPSKTPQRGGWQGSKWLDLRDDVCRISEINHQLLKADLPLTHCITLTPPDGIPKPKRWISNQLSILTKMMKRAGLKHVGLTVYERNRKGRRFDLIGTDGLHAHHAVHIPSGFAHVVRRFVELAPAGERHVRKFTQDGGGVWYLTKQRQHLHGFTPILNGRPHTRRYGDFIAGPRWTLTKPAKAIVGEVHAA